MSDIDLDAIRARANGTPRPLDEDFVDEFDKFDHSKWAWHRYGDEIDRDFTTAIQADAHALITEVERLRKQIEACRRELAWFEETFPCDGFCSTNGGAEEDCSRHGRSQKDLWRIIDEVREQRDGALVTAERLRERESRRRGKRKYQQMQFPVPVSELLGCADGPELLPEVERLADAEIMRRLHPEVDQ